MAGVTYKLDSLDSYAQVLIGRATKLRTAILDDRFEGEKLTQKKREILIARAAAYEEIADEIRNSDLYAAEQTPAMGTVEEIDGRLIVVVGGRDVAELPPTVIARRTP